MRKYAIPAIFILALFFVNCHKSGPCDNGGIVYCVGTFYGTARLTDTTLKLPDFYTNDIIYRTGNSVGITYSFSFQSYLHDTFIDNLVHHTVQQTCGIANCDDYCNSEHEIAEYVSTSAPFNLEFKREKNYYEFLNVLSTDLIKNSKDRLMINLYSRSDTSVFRFKVLMNHTDSGYGYCYHDSLYLGTRHHYQVFESYSVRPNQSGSYIEGIYYTVANGMIGYYYNTNEVWFLQ